MRTFADKWTRENVIKEVRRASNGVIRTLDPSTSSKEFLEKVMFAHDGDDVQGEFSRWVFALHEKGGSRILRFDRLVIGCRLKVATRRPDQISDSVAKSWAFACFPRSMPFVSTAKCKHPLTPIARDVVWSDINSRMFTLHYNQDWIPLLPEYADPLWADCEPAAALFERLGV